MAAISLTIFAAGCGGSATPRSGDASASVPARFRHSVELALEYSNCIRTHGVPNFADPKISASSTEVIIQNPQMTPAEVASPAYKSATSACVKYLPQPQTPAATASSNSEQQALRLANCMRTHGVPNFPDATAGGAFRLGSGINPQAPAAAMATCRMLRPHTLELTR